MKKVFLIGMICALILAAAGYFWRLHEPVRDEELPTYKMVEELQVLLNGAPYMIGDYKKSVFDCSNEAALLHDHLTRNGYRCTVVIGVTVEWEWFPVIFHSWLIAEKDGKKIWIEPVIKTVVYQGYYKDFIKLAHFRSLKLLRILSKIFGLPGEWDGDRPTGEMIFVKVLRNLKPAFSIG